MKDKYGVFQDAGCYPGTDVPINKLDIKNAATLEEAEAAFAAASAESIELGTPPFDLAYLCDLHRSLKRIREGSGPFPRLRGKAGMGAIEVRLLGCVLSVGKNAAIVVDLGCSQHAGSGLPPPEPRIKYGAGSSPVTRGREQKPRDEA